jgi:hypothetical protein
MFGKGFPFLNSGGFYSRGNFFPLIICLCGTMFSSTIGSVERLSFCSFSAIRYLREYSLIEVSEAIDSRRPGGYTSKIRVRDRYHIVGFISSGTYGRVYKAVGKNGKKGEFAIKKYSPPIFDLFSSDNPPDSSPTRKARQSNTRACHNPPFAKWHCAQNSRTQMSSS